MHLLLILSEWKKIILARNERRSDVWGEKYTTSEQSH